MSAVGSNLYFVDNATTIAREAMLQIRPDLVDKYVQVISFLSLEPAFASNRRGRSAPQVGSEDYIRRQAAGFAQGRVPKSPEPPSTIPDPMVSVILKWYWDIPRDNVSRVTTEHQLAMASENIVGAILEHYIASIAENHGWIWCSGEMVKHVDFVKPPSRVGQRWRMLQVKNRDNSENSSSSQVRTGTTIEKWYRTKSRTGATMWKAFPDSDLRIHLSEDGFENFTRQYLQALRSTSS